ncbi:MAG TPA: hypothetical protein VF765_25400 [Polyangiaceae bacterium]
MVRASRPPPAASETVLALPERIEPLRNVRSTILVASVGNIRASGYFDDYARRIPEHHRAPLFETIAGLWVPVDSALAHYAACDALNLPESSQVDFGKRSVERVGQSMVGTAIRMAKQVGATPWTFIPHIQRFWARGYDGGGLAAYKLGPKDARLDLVQCDLCESPFFRRALRGWVTHLILLFCSTVYVHEMTGPDGVRSMSMRAQWV